MLYGIRRIVASVIGWPKIDRRHIAASYLHGHGLEIGALHNPAPLPSSVRVRYVDRMDVPALRRQYPELAGERLVEVGVVDDGQKLATIADSSEDFVVANHLLEHAQDPISMVENAMRVLVPGGVLLLAIPDKRSIFDKDRPVTTLDHLIKDRRDGGASSREAHFREWVLLTEKLEGAEGEERLSSIMKTDLSIHFHVWTYQEMLELMLYLRARMAFEVELIARQTEEVIFVLRKVDGRSGGGKP